MANGNVTYVQAQRRERTPLGVDDVLRLCLSVGEEDVWCLKVALCMCQCVNLPYSQSSVLNCVFLAVSSLTSC